LRFAFSSVPATATARLIIAGHCHLFFSLTLICPPPRIRGSYLSSLQLALVNRDPTQSDHNRIRREIAPDPETRVRAVPFCRRRRLQCRRDHRQSRPTYTRLQSPPLSPPLPPRERSAGKLKVAAEERIGRRANKEYPEPRDSGALISRDPRDIASRRGTGRDDVIGIGEQGDKISRSRRGLRVQARRRDAVRLLLIGV